MELKLSNKDLAILITICILFSLISLLLNLIEITPDTKTGFATGDGNATVYFEIANVVDINFSNSYIDFGNGYVVPGNENCTINTISDYEPSECFGFNNLSQGLILENIGTCDVNLSIRFSTPVEDFINDESQLRYKLTTNGSNSCLQYLNPANFSAGIIQDTNYHLVCSQFSDSFENNILIIDVELIIDNNMTGNSGQSVMNIDAQAQQAS